MLSIVATGEPRPDRLEGIKDEAYHAKCGRYCASNGNSHQHSAYLEKIARNKKYYKGDQWFEKEDTESFFKDETNQDRNRIKIINNLIKPMIIQHRGNAIRMNINARVKNVSPMAVTRRERMLAKLKFLTNEAKTSPFGEDMKKTYPIGNSVQETEQIFGNIYVDKFVSKINMLLTYVAENNKFYNMQERAAEELALSGIVIAEDMEWSGDQVFAIRPSEEFFWDRTAKEYDLTDAEFMGLMPYMLPTEIFEHYQPEDQENRKQIENFAQQWKSASEQSGRVPVCKSYWKDTEVYEYGYVTDPYGYPYLTRINFTYEGEEKPRYTDADVIEVNSDRARRILRGKKKRRLMVDVIRMCHFIPKEILASQTQGAAVKDIVLEWGLLPYQETEYLDINNVKFPFKIQCWGLIDGEVLTPIDDAISPQRFINRILSVAENQINNSRGSGTVYDTGALGEGGEDEMIRNMNQSKPVGVDARGRGIQNVVGNYDSTVKDGTMVMFNIISAMKGFTDGMTGNNDALRGESMGEDQLVGVTQLLIQRGALMQEPFYNSISNLFLQMYQAIATRGKRIYADNERELSIAVGDDGAEILVISKEMKIETFRCFVKRENINDVLINSGNTMIMTLSQLGFLDKKRFANLWGRSTPDEVAQALRESAKEQEETGRMQQQADKEQATEQQATEMADRSDQQRMMAGMMDREDTKDQQKRDHDLDKIYAKTMSKVYENSQSAPKGKSSMPNV